MAPLSPPAASRTLVMGVVNVTPDSFSDGGKFLDADAAIAHGLSLIEAGADILDIGGESTRPGAEPVSDTDEVARALPVIKGLAGKGARLSIDTMKPAVARAAVAAGAGIWNDVAGLREPGALETAADLGCEIMLMHMQGEPRTMQAAPHYDDVVGEVSEFLAERAKAAMTAGVSPDNIWLDPGIGFGKDLSHNLALLANLDRIVDLGFPVVLGVSRKRFIRSIDPAAKTAEARLGGSLAAALAGAAAGVAAVRVHDVFETSQALKVQEAILGAR